MPFPLHKLFYSDSVTRLPVTIHIQSTFLTTVDGVGFAVRGVHRTAPRTPLTRMVSRDVSKRNTIVDTPDDNLFLDEFEWDKGDLAVALPP